jgi:uncharacterized protein (TIGR03435 family)
MKTAITGLCLLASVSALCQTGPKPAPEFEVASMKVAADPKAITLTKGGPGTDSPGQWTATNWPLYLLVTRAWHVSLPSEISGPASMEDTGYDIAAKVPPNTTPDEFNLMIQSLLVQRIGLVVHHELREQPVYELSIAKGGLKLKEAAPLRDGEKARAYNGNAAGGGWKMVARMFRFSDIVKWWERFAHLPIVDRTGLTGNFDLDLEFPPEDPLPPGSPTDGASLPKLAFREAVEKQLGLRLEPGRAKVDVLVVDRFNKVPLEY